MTAGAPEATGTIYDIGYRHYDGPRLGRREAITALVGQGLRAVFGLGRSGRSKILPWGAVVLAVMPAGVAVAIRVLAGELGEAITMWNYENYLWSIGALLPIFLAAQAPELVVNDMRHHVLPLYFSRPIGRADYVIAKLLALSLGLLALTLVPVLVLFLGRVLSEADIVTALGNDADALPGILGSAVMHAVVLASLGLAVSSLAGRRAYAAAAILAIYLVGSAIGGILGEIGGPVADLAPLANPLAILDGARQWLFGGTAVGSPVETSDLPLPMYGLATLVLAAACWAVLWLRYRRVRA